MSSVLKSIVDLMSRECELFPSRYVSLDIETTGFDRRQDLIVEIGWCVVIDGAVVENRSTILDWTRNANIDQAWLQQRLIEVKASVELKDGKPTGRTYHMTYGRMAAEGKPAVETLLEEHINLLIQESAGHPIVGHNWLNFDSQMLAVAMSLLRGGERMKTDAGHYRKIDEIVCSGAFGCPAFDTGMALKAHQLGTAGGGLPRPGETSRDFFYRVGRIFAKGVRWSLDGYAVPTFGLEKKYGLDPTQAHSAAYDALVTHYLLQELLKLAKADVCV
jgi:DNA polymerase III epsilon subunit-like protein